MRLRFYLGQQTTTASPIIIDHHYFATATFLLKLDSYDALNTLDYFTSSPFAVSAPGAIYTAHARAGQRYQQSWPAAPCQFASLKAFRYVISF
jgi:hypothetical protein